MKGKTKILGPISKSEATPMRKSVTAQHANLTPQSVDGLSGIPRVAGNLAIQRLLRSGAIRTKFEISQPGDMYEQEADRVADVVMCMSESWTSRRPTTHQEAASSGKKRGLRPHLSQNRSDHSFSER